MLLSKNDISQEYHKECGKSIYGQVIQSSSVDRIQIIHAVAATFYEHYDEILNFYNNRYSNAMAECFNAKIKLFRANLRGVADKKFFLFRIANLFAYPH